MRNTNRLLLALICLIVASLSCKNDDDDTPPEVMTDETLEVLDYRIVNGAMARVEDFVIKDLTSPDPTHVNYGVILTSEQLEQVQYGDKMFWQYDEDNLSNRVVGVVFNLYSPIVVQEGTAAQNILGGADERTFTMAADPVNNSEGDYLFDGASFAILDSEDFDNSRSYFATEGTIKVKGTFPDLEMTFDLLLEDDIRQLIGRLQGTIELTYQVIENR